MPDDPETPQKRIRPKQIAAHVCLIAVLVAATALWTVHAKDADLRDARLEHARLASRAVNIVRIVALTGSEADLSSPDYVRLREQLSLMRESLPDCQLASLCGQRADGTIFSFVNSAALNPVDESSPGQPCDNLPEEVRQAFSSTEDSSVGPYAYHGDIRFTSFVPIRDASSGAVLAILRMDFNAAHWIRTILTQSAFSLSMVAVLALLALTATALHASRQRVQEERRALAEAGRRFRSLFDNSVSGIAIHNVILDETGKPVDYVFTDANHAFEVQTGVRATDVIGRRATEAIPGIGETRLIEAFGEVATTGRLFEAEFYFPPFGRHYVMNAYQMGPGCFATTFRDISARKKTEEALQQSEARFRAIADAAQDGILMMDPAGRIRFFNQAAERLFGWSAEEALGLDLHTLLAPERYRPLYRDAAHGFRSNGDGSVFGRTLEMAALRKDGTEFPIEASLSRVALGGEWHAIGIVRDISDRKQAEQALRSAHAELETRVQDRTALLAKANTDLMVEVAERARAEETLRQTNRMMRVLSECNQAIVRSSSESELLDETCRLLVNFGGYAMAWVGFVTEGEQDEVRPAASWGFGEPGIGSITIEEPGGEPSSGIVGEAIRTGKPCICTDMQANEALATWRDEAVSRGCTAHAVIPIPLSAAGTKAVLGMSTAKPDSFTGKEMEVLLELAADLGHALAALRYRAEHRVTQEGISCLNALKERLLSQDALPNKLQLITDATVSAFHADFARIWMLGEGDLCEKGCLHAETTDAALVCRNRSSCLHLVASSGRYTHLNGGHRRAPLGCCTIGLVAVGEESAFITNDIVHEPRLHDREWAIQLGLVSFASRRLISPDGSAVGVLALFSRQPIADAERQLLEDLGNTTSHVIVTGLAAEALLDSERRLQAILNGCPLPQLVIDKHHKVISWNKPLEAYSRIGSPDILGTNEHWKAFYTTPRPCLVDLIVDGLTDRIPQLYGDKVKPAPLLEGAFSGTDHFPIPVPEGSWLHYTAAPILDGQGRVIGALETFEDVSELKRAEEELRTSHGKLEMRVAQRTQALTQANTSLTCEIERRKLMVDELGKAHGEVERLLASMSSFLIGVSKELCITRWNAAAETTFGIPSKEARLMRMDSTTIRWDWNSIAVQIPGWPTVAEPVRLTDIRYTRTDGTEGFLDVTVDPIRDEAGNYEGCFLIGTDTTARRDLESQLLQAQKLESVGRLAAGIAHEINTPTQYVGDNVEFLQIAYESILPPLQALPKLIEAHHNGSVPDALLSEVEELTESANLNYLAEQVPRAIEQSLEGVGRIASIVHAMKEFSHPGSVEKTCVDLNQGIRSTATVSRNEWKYVADLELDLCPTSAMVMCVPGELNQVFLNMIVNAAHAIGDVVGADGARGKGKITIGSRLDGEWCEIRISDTGAGIPEEIRERIFDPFFTTKEVGRGTGQGLAIARSVVIDKHKGTISVESEVGKGTTFIIRLPVNG